MLLLIVYLIKLNIQPYKLISMNFPLKFKYIIIKQYHEIYFILNIGYVIYQSKTNIYAICDINNYSNHL